MILAFASLMCVILAGHFLRMGALFGVLMCLSVPIAAFASKARWVLRTFQAVLLLGSVSWIMTALAIGAQRRAAGQPWLRMALILGTVSVFSALAAALLSRRSVLDRYPAVPDEPAS